MHCVLVHAADARLTAGRHSLCITSYMDDASCCTPLCADCSYAVSALRLLPTSPWPLNHWAAEIPGEEKMTKQMHQKRPSSGQFVTYMLGWTSGSTTVPPSLHFDAGRPAPAFCKKFFVQKGHAVSATAASGVVPEFVQNLGPSWG